MSDAERAQLGVDDAVPFDPLRFIAAGVMGLACLLCAAGVVAFVVVAIHVGSVGFAIGAVAAVVVLALSTVGLAQMAWRYAHSLPLMITTTTTPAERRRLLEAGEQDLIVLAPATHRWRGSAKQAFMQPTTTVVPPASPETLTPKPPR